MHADAHTALAIVWTVLAALDVVLTLRNLRAGAIETNAVMRLGQRLLGRDGGIVLTKAAAVAAVWYWLPLVPTWALVLGVAVHLYWAARGFRK